MRSALKTRGQRAEQIAKTDKIHRNGNGWIVSSQSGSGKYMVQLDGEQPRCTCPDHEERGSRCKHILAVEVTLRHEKNGSGGVVTQTVRVTYGQNWPAYNKAQTQEKAQFQVLLNDLCGTVAEPAQTFGRPRLPLRDMVFSTTFKIYSTVSGRRFMSDLTDAHTKGYLSRVPHFNSIFNYLEMPGLTEIMQDLIVRSSLPLKSIEQDFAVDSTGFTTSRFIRWYDHKYRGMREEHDWVKAHIMCGVKTNIVTAVEIRERDASDTKLLPPLVETTAKNFKLAEVSADKGYSGVNNTNVIAKHGATPFIAYKNSATGSRGGLWEQMYHYFQFQRADFLNHYHKRSNVESTISMIKAKFSDHVRSKTEVAMKNEVLCKILAHNICVVIQSMHELGIEPEFGTASPSN